MKLDYDNRRTQNAAAAAVNEEKMTQSPLEIFSTFYEERNHVFHHKTQHPKFTILVPLFLAMWIAGIGYLYWKVR
jgi:Predicted membrane protein